MNLHFFLGDNFDNNTGLFGFLTSITANPKYIYNIPTKGIILPYKPVAINTISSSILRKIRSPPLNFESFDIKIGFFLFVISITANPQ